MKRIIIYEPAMCCSTGLCGPTINPELLRISTVINNLNQNGIEVERYNLSGNPEKFMENKLINDILNLKGIAILPITIVDGKLFKVKQYPSNEEISNILGIDKALLQKNKVNGCGCNGGCC